MTMLTLNDVGVTQGGETLVESVGFSVEPGAWVGIIGPNGAGKTTILRAIAGLIESSGDISVDGKRISQLSIKERAQCLAMVPQRPELPAQMRVIDYVLLARTSHLRFWEMEGAGDLVAAQRALASLGSDGLASRRLGSLSGGEVQRVVLARALVQGGPLLLLDEPTASLDVGQAQNVMAMVDTMRRTRGLTVVSAIHDLTLAAQFCDRLVLVAGGRVSAMGEPRTVLTESSIRTHYGARVRILHEENGSLVIIPLRELEHLPGVGLGGLSN